MKKSSFQNMVAGVALGLLSLWLPACMDPGIVVKPRCIDSLDCPQGYRCDPTTRYCEPIPTPESVVDFELTPLKGSGGAPTQVPGLDLGELSTDAISLQVAPAVPLTGWISSPYAPGGIPGTLVATRSPDIDQRRLVWNISVGNDGSFKAELSPGSYDVLFKPTNREVFPQLMLSGFTLPTDYPNGMDLSLGFPAYPSETELFNQEILLLVRGQVLVSQTYPHPATGIKVDGITEDGLRTSLAVPDTQGYFYLRLPLRRVLLDPAGGYQDCYPQLLDLTIRPDSSDNRLPTVVVAGLELDNPDLGTFYLGEVPASKLVSGAVLSPDSQPIPECQLRFQADNIGNGFFTHQIKTDLLGQFATTLPAGTYSVTAIPDLTGEVQMATTTLNLANDLSDLSITLPFRNRLQGTVRDNTGNTVADVIVRVKRLGTVSGADDGVIRNYEVMTIMDGSFDALVDKGRYTITFIPPAASGLPRSLPQVAYVTDDVTMKPAATTLSQPAVIKGDVHDQSGMPMCGVTIDVYHSDETDADLIGQTISGGDSQTCTGAYAVIIPADLVTQQ